LESKKIVAGPKPEPAKKGNQPKVVPIRGKAINQSGTGTWGRNIPGVKFGPWVCTFEKGNICDYERNGVSEDGTRVKQTHNNRVVPPKVNKPAKVEVVDETIEIGPEDYRESNARSSTKRRWRDPKEAQAAADNILKSQGWSYV